MQHPEASQGLVLGGRPGGKIEAINIELFDSGQIPGSGHVREGFAQPSQLVECECLDSVDGREVGGAGLDVHADDLGKGCDAMLQNVERTSGSAECLVRSATFFCALCASVRWWGGITFDIVLSSTNGLQASRRILRTIGGFTNTICSGILSNSILIFIVECDSSKFASKLTASRAHHPTRHSSTATAKVPSPDEISALQYDAKDAQLRHAGEGNTIPSLSGMMSLNVCITAIDVLICSAFTDQGEESTNSQIRNL